MVINWLNWFVNNLIVGTINMLFNLDLFDGVSLGSSILYFGLLTFVLMFVISRISRNRVYKSKDD